MSVLWNSSRKRREEERSHCASRMWWCWSLETRLREPFDTPSLSCWNVDRRLRRRFPDFYPRTPIFVPTLIQSHAVLTPTLAPNGAVRMPSSVLANASVLVVVAAAFTVAVNCLLLPETALGHLKMEDTVRLDASASFSSLTRFYEFLVPRVCPVALMRDPNQALGTSLYATPLPFSLRRGQWHSSPTYVGRLRSTLCPSWSCDHTTTGDSQWPASNKGDGTTHPACHYFVLLGEQRLHR